jgi:hypothetical protein
VGEKLPSKTNLVYLKHRLVGFTSAVVWVSVFDPIMSFLSFSSCRWAFICGLRLRWDEWCSSDWSPENKTSLCGCLDWRSRDWYWKSTRWHRFELE